MDGTERKEADGQISYELDGKDCRFYLYGELDHHSVRRIRESIDEVLVDHRPVRVTLDLDGVTFTDSAGLGLVLGRYTRIKDSGGSLTLVNVPPQFMKILELSGASRLIEIKPKAARDKK